MDKILKREIKVVSCQNSKTGQAKIETITFGRFGGDSEFPIAQYDEYNCLNKEMKSCCVICKHNTI